MRSGDTSRCKMKWITLIVCLAVTHYSAHGRQNDDLLAVGEVVRFHMFVENDYYLTVTACGALQCGGVRVEGVDAKGMGYWTFQRDAYADPRRIKWRTKASPFGTVFVPGREYTFKVYRPTEHEMQLWIEGQEFNIARVRTDAGPLRLHVKYDHGTFYYLDNEEDKAGAPSPQVECPPGGPAKLQLDALEEGADILEVTMGCRYKGNSKAQSMCIVYLAVEGEKEAREVYRSPVSRGDYSPQLQQKVKLPFRFSQQQNLIFNVYEAPSSDCDTPSPEQLVGTLETPLASINKMGKVELSMSKTKDEDFSVRYSLNCDEKITLYLSGRDIPGEGDVYLKILKSAGSANGDKNSRRQFVDVAQTEKVRRDTSLVQWQNLTLSVNALCDGDQDRLLKVYALEKTQDDDVALLGHFLTTVNELKKSQNKFILNANGVGDAYNSSGEIYIGEVPPRPSFSQYMSVGFELLGTLQIDFTGSNLGPPPLHLLSDQPNHYQLAIHSVGQIVQNFVAGGILKAYGFGAKLPQGYGGGSYDFPLNFTGNNPDCQGAKGVLAAYKEFVGQLDFDGPTIFAPVIKKIVKMARQYTDGSKYIVHLLMTDGKLDDVDATKQAILEASALPVSIIIVGVGGADLSVLRAMAGEQTGKVTFWDEGQRTERDILQFVAMNDFPLEDTDKLMRQLQDKVLQKIPKQYLEYMQINKIAPKPPRNTKITRVCE